MARGFTPLVSVTPPPILPRRPQRRQYGTRSGGAFLDLEIPRPKAHDTGHVYQPRPEPTTGRTRRQARPARERNTSTAAKPATADPMRMSPLGAPRETWQLLPDGVRRAVSRVLAPAYRRFVLDAPGELERSIGLTLVHLMWLEVCDQVRLAEAAADPVVSYRRARRPRGADGPPPAPGRLEVSDGRVAGEAADGPRGLRAAAGRRPAGPDARRPCPRSTIIRLTFPAPTVAAADQGSLRTGGNRENRGSAGLQLPLLSPVKARSGRGGGERGKNWKWSGGVDQ